MVHVIGNSKGVWFNVAVQLRSQKTELCDCHGTNQKQQKGKSTTYELNYKFYCKMSHQPCPIKNFPLLLNHLSCQFWCSFTTDIGSETRHLTNNNNSLSLYYTGEEGEGRKEEEKGEEGWERRMKRERGKKRRE